MGTWRPRRSTPLDGGVPGGIVSGCTAEEPQEPMPSFGDHVAKLSQAEVGVWMLRSEEQESERQSLVPRVPHTGAQTAVEWAANGEKPGSVVQLSEDTEVPSLAADRPSSVG